LRCTTHRFDLQFEAVYIAALESAFEAWFAEKAAEIARQRGAFLSGNAAFRVEDFARWLREGSASNERLSALRVLVASVNRPGLPLPLRALL
jgi:hypothetical protein